MFEFSKNFSAIVQIIENATYAQILSAWAVSRAEIFVKNILKNRSGESTLANQNFGKMFSINDNLI